MSDLAQVKRRIWSNTISSYVRTMLAMTVGLISFRLLFQAFTREEFGFWSVLWSVFGYGILLDFGFGFAAQKRVAELSVQRDWERLSQVLSSIFVFYWGISLLIISVVLVGASRFVLLLGVSPHNLVPFRHALLLFFLGIGLAFPMGIFPEILRGQQRIKLANNLISFFLVLRLALTFAAVHYHWPFLAIVFYTLLCTLVPDSLAAAFALRSLPGVKIRLRFFSKAIMHDTAKFSIFAYLSTTTQLLITKTAQVIVGILLSVSSVALFQAGAKVAEVFLQFSRQLRETLSPAAAHLHASGDRAGLQNLLINSSRWNLMVATPLFLLSQFHFSGLLRMLTGEAHSPASTVYVGHLFLFWYYSTSITHGVCRPIFIMTGHERRLLRLSIAEAVLTLFLSISLVWGLHSIVGIGLGSLLPGVYIGWFHLWPWVAKDVELSGWTVFRRTVWPSWCACLPMILLSLFLYRFPLPGPYYVQVFVVGALEGLVGLLGIWFVALLPVEREHLLRKSRGLWFRFRSRGATVVT